MTKEQELAYTIKGFLSELDAVKQAEVHACVVKIKALLEEHPEAMRLAIAVVGSELAV